MMDIVERAKIKSGMLRIREPIKFGSDVDLIDEMAAEIELLRNERDLLWEELAAARNSLAGLGYPNIASTICDAALKEGE